MTTSPVTLGKCPNSGPDDATILIVGEAPGAQEIMYQTPFIGPSGNLLRSSLLNVLGIAFDECKVTNVSPYRPTGNDISIFFASAKQGKSQDLPYILNRYVHWPIQEGLVGLANNISETTQKIILLGGTALWALTGETSIEKYHGSLLPYTGALHTALKLPKPRQSITLLPLYHPAYVLRFPKYQPIFQRDIARFNAQQSETDITYNLLTSKSAAIDYIESIAEDDPVSVDIETSGERLLCIGFAKLSDRVPHVLPLSTWNIPSYFTTEDEMAIMSALSRQPLSVIGQYFQTYDRPWLARQYGLDLNCIGDTYIAEGVLNPGQPRDLSTLSSIYCQSHLYWKDDRKSITSKSISDESLFLYNAIDTSKTLEIYQEQLRRLEKENLLSQYQFQMDIANLLFKLAIQGISVNAEAMIGLRQDISDLTQQLSQDLTYLVPFFPDGWWRSSARVKELCYDIFNIKPLISRKTKTSTVGKDAIPSIVKREPILSPILQRISDIRTLTQASGFIDSAVDPVTNRIHTSLYATGAVTMRFSSSTDPFGFGGNLQALSGGRTDDTGIRHTKGFVTPNLRKLFAPDPDHYILETDYRQADAHYVAWDANDQPLMEFFTAMKSNPSLDLHTENASLIFNTATPTKAQRQLAKMGCHAVNYFVSAKTLAASLSISIVEANRFIDRWFQIHPAIQQWQNTILSKLERTASIVNIWGYKYHFHTPPRLALNAALSYIGQGGVAITCSKAMLALSTLPGLTVLTQNHDSIIYQIHRDTYPYILPAITKAFDVAAPYPTPLTMAVDHKISSKSWGDAKPFNIDNPPTHITW